MLAEKPIELRAVEPNDIDFIFEIENNQSHWLLSQTLQPFSKNTLIQYIESIQDIYTDKQLRLVIIKDQESIGLLDLYEYDALNQRVGLGIILKKEFRKQGWGQQSVQMACDYCFEILGLHQVHCSILSNNLASEELFEKVGFQLSGICKDWIKSSNGFLDQKTYQKFKH